MRSQKCFVHSHVAFKLGCFRLECGQRSGAVYRSRRSALSPGRCGLILHPGYFGELSRLIFNSINAIIKILKLLPLLIIFGPQSLVFSFDPQMLQLAVSVRKNHRLTRTTQQTGRRLTLSANVCERKFCECELWILKYGRQ